MSLQTKLDKFTDSNDHRRQEQYGIAEKRHSHNSQRPVPSIEELITYAMLKYMVTLEESPVFSLRAILSIGKQAYYVVIPCSVPSEKLFCEASRVAWRCLEHLKSRRLIRVTRPWGKTFLFPTEEARIEIESWEKQNESDVDTVSNILQMIEENNLK